MMNAVGNLVDAFGGWIDRVSQAIDRFGRLLERARLVPRLELPPHPLRDERPVWKLTVYSLSFEDLVDHLKQIGDGGVDWRVLSGGGVHMVFVADHEATLLKLIIPDENHQIWSTATFGEFHWLRTKYAFDYEVVNRSDPDFPSDSERKDFRPLKGIIGDYDPDDPDPRNALGRRYHDGDIIP